ncbi:RelA/SpoT family protein [Aquabacterium sp. J223]|uniref:RelA/SpoT family protein n=1 Tax=Aquabacterium sp. J223 TaxID=2898431 RepID=UPI0021ADDB94|nr:bifunctional (p)ppGpp synthetase/guanosine-3',5'-bis(diphosphate) 3'-pyrophosphohydrolase [Aquabacterium sp. J223]UUX94239.1 bifunctional (p)ppGpp synthetase/guanosine-3',5'-bis(diphosphate) 3'-pyrophosphohydrolase [Aquabacterium sp. J223]
MKTGSLTGLPAGGAPAVAAAPIVRLLDADTDAGAPRDDVARARAFAEPLLAGQRFDSGEDALAHADGVAAILAGIGAAPPLLAASYLVYASDFLQRPEEVVRKAFGESYARLVGHTRRLVQVQRAAREASLDGARRAEQTERVRKMLLAFSRDLRVVLLRLASRLQTLRHYAASKQACPEALARESREVFAPLANRLGIWPIKWELEDLSFRFLDPAAYKAVAALLDETRLQREQSTEAARRRMADALQAAGVPAEVQGRPKHLYSIFKKMRGKGLDIGQVMDLRALRVIVDDVQCCYAALSAVHERFAPVPGEYDDYIARPKPNGYQSLHTVVLDDGRPVEVQIRTREMHEHAEHGVAAHWAYKEAGAKGYAGVAAAGDFEQRVADARKAVLRQLLAWERDLAAPQGDGEAAARHADDPLPAPGGDAVAGRFDDRLYVFTPQAAVIELTAGATPIDFAYALHTDLGHRCRGARVDGAMVPLNTPLQNGQTVEVVAAKEGGPSLDWLNPELGYLKSARAKAKVRAWFNNLQQGETIARGREAVEKLLQREGRTALKLDELAARLGFRSADALFEVVGKDEYSLRHIEQLLRPAEPAPEADELLALKKARPTTLAPAGGVLVVGVDSLLTSLARCCRPAPPDAIAGFVTRGRGVAVHRADCPNFRHMAARSPERRIAVTWGRGRAVRGAPLYPVGVMVEGSDRPGLLRDISEVFAKEKLHLTGVQMQTLRDGGLGTTRMNCTVEVSDAQRLQRVLGQVLRIDGVRQARRR